MSRIAVILCVFFTYLPALAGAVMAGKNLLPNESFENRPGFKDEDPRGWAGWNSSYNGLDLIERQKGQQSVYLACPKQNDSEGIFYTYKKAKPGDKYVFSVYVKNSAEDPIRGNAYGQISIEWRKTTRDKDNKEVFVEISRDFGPKFGPELATMRWVQFTMAATAPQDSDNCNFVIQFFNKENGGGKFYADDASVEEIKKSIAIKDFVMSRTRPNIMNRSGTERASSGGETLSSGGNASSSAGNASTESVFVAADFDSGSKPNNLGGDMGTWNKDPNDKTQGCNMSFSSSEKQGGKGFAIQLDYDVDSPNKGAMDGFWMKLQDVNAAQYDKLSLWIKGDGNIGFSAKVRIELKNSKKETGAYTIIGITRDWKRFIIPLSQFSGLTDRASMSEFVIRFDDEVNADKKQGRIYVDNIAFVR